MKNKKVNHNEEDDREQELLRELKLLHRNQTIITGCSSDYSPDQENPFDFGDAEMCVLEGRGGGDVGWAFPVDDSHSRWRHVAPAVRPTTLALSGASYEEE